MSNQGIIDGMYVIETTPIKGYTTFSVIFIGISIFILLVCGLAPVVRLCLVTKGARPDPRRAVRIMTRNMIFTLLVLTVLACKIPYLYGDTGKYQYKCKFDNTVTAKDITDYYEIISVTGDIWTVIEK